MKKPIHDEKHLDELIKMGEEILNDSIEVENYEVSQDINNMINALKTKSVDEVAKELSKYDIVKIEYRDFIIRILQYQGIYGAHVSDFSHNIIFETSGESEEECELNCKEFIDMLINFLDGLNALTRM